MSAYLDKTDEAPALREQLYALAGITEFHAYRFLDDVAGEHKRYETFQIVCPNDTLVLKRFDSEKRFEAEKAVYALFPEGMPVPRVLAASDSCMLTECIPGKDLSVASDESIEAAARSIAGIMNAFPFDRTYDRTVADDEIACREKRLACLSEEPLLRAAYEAFLLRAREMPLTLANGDLVPINCIYTGKRAYLIDWEYGGFMPYAFDLGRFLAHSGTDALSVYRITEAQKKRFVDTVYKNLTVKPDRAVYDRDIDFAVFDECIMILRFWLEDPSKERDADFRRYYETAAALARKLAG